MRNLVGKNITKIAVGMFHNLVLTSDGDCFAWGSGTYGATTNNIVSITIPTKIRSGDMAGKLIVDIAAGAYHSVALCNDTKVYAWGACMLNTK
jgi:alpha-tubulin suppressor-like RCC1 family protein